MNFSLFWVNLLLSVCEGTSGPSWTLCVAQGQVSSDQSRDKQSCASMSAANEVTNRLGDWQPKGLLRLWPMMKELKLMHKACTASVLMGAKQKQASRVRLREIKGGAVCWQWYLAEVGAPSTTAITVIPPPGSDELHGSQKFQFSTALTLLLSECSKVTGSFLLEIAYRPPAPI